MYDAGLSQEVFRYCLSSVPLSRSLSSIRTYVRFVCEWDHRDLGVLAVRGPVRRLYPGAAEIKADPPGWVVKMLLLGPDVHDRQVPERGPRR